MLFCNITSVLFTTSAPREIGGMLPNMVINSYTISSTVFHSGIDHCISIGCPMYLPRWPKVLASPAKPIITCHRVLACSYRNVSQ